MYNLNDALAAISNAARINSSPHLTDDEKRQLLAELIASVPPAYNRGYLDVTNAALERLYATFVPAVAEEARPTEGSQDATPVASGPGTAEQAAEAGPTEGLQEQAQDAPSVGGRGNGGGTPAQASAAPQGRKQGPHRRK